MDYKIIAGLSLRAGYILYQLGITTIIELKAWTKEHDLMELLQLKDCGLKTYHEILLYCISKNIKRKHY